MPFPMYYGVLIQISRGYVPCSKEGCIRVPTRLPVAIKCIEHRMPLDLHVLSLPLAFILSQDQTLHCK